MLISSLEPRVLPVLTAIPRPVVLASGDGRVIASNSPYWAPGMSIALGDRTGGKDASPRSWVLGDVDAAD